MFDRKTKKNEKKKLLFFTEKIHQKKTSTTLSQPCSQAIPRESQPFTTWIVVIFTTPSQDFLLGTSIHRGFLLLNPSRAGFTSLPKSIFINRIENDWKPRHSSVLIFCRLGCKKLAKYEAQRERSELKASANNLKLEASRKSIVQLNFIFVENVSHFSS